MAWSWSHAPEAYESARLNLTRVSVKKITEIWAEWKVKQAETEEETGWDQKVYDDARAEAKAIAKKLDKSVLAEDIWQWMEGQATCDNGGFNAWACPYGCGCHKVSFE